MTVDDPGLAVRQSLALLLVVPPLTGAVTAVVGDGAVTGALLGVLMALTTAALNVRLGLFGDPERAGWLGRGSR
ncbi:hypothetical protein [Candidatus Halobonum tyrrellensis]|uniref:Uncharacterized protein n=1 Tax=Candidatus Halobonum tyrrellensis G22 TaxID=1324957 RepID=V4HIU6_9EURY|nr:hypothetical protein [Candidatus Halobonum tyrrellensis]ESP87819.1 hypothetical protein K933_12126 [Candidatus Halobonum tyrrellensis G22]